MTEKLYKTDLTTDTGQALIPIKAPEEICANIKNEEKIKN